MCWPGECGSRSPPTRARSAGTSSWAEARALTARRSRHTTWRTSRERGSPDQTSTAIAAERAETDLSPTIGESPKPASRVGERRPAVRQMLPDWPGFLPPPPRSVHAVLPHTALRRSSPPAFGSLAPRPVGSRRDDGAVEADQPDLVGVVGQQPPSVPGAPLAALGDKASHPRVRVERDLVEGVSGVSVAEVPRPAAQEAVDVLHDVLDRFTQPAAVRELTDPTAGALHRLS